MSQNTKTYVKNDNPKSFVLTKGKIRNILITGAASGIGLATATEFARQGWMVYATDRDRERLATECERLRQTGGRVRDFWLDVTDGASIEAVIGEIGRQDGGLDVLVNNAGYAVLGPVEETSEAETRAQFEVNFFGLLNVTRAALPLLRRRRGRIINLSSMMGRVSTPGWGIYSASKYAIEGMSEALRMELAPWGVRVILIEPGSVLTGFSRTAHASFPDRFRGPDSLYPGLRPSLENYTDFTPNHRPARVARIIFKAGVTNWPKARYMIDWNSRKDVLLYHLLPSFVTDRAVRRRVGYKPDSKL